MFCREEQRKYWGGMAFSQAEQRKAENQTRRKAKDTMEE
jgi:hypothetical protein